MPRAHASPPRRRRAAFTLVEAAVAMAVMSILIVGAAAAVMTSTSALDRGDDRSARCLRRLEAADQISADLAVATAVLERTPTAITILVADRNADGAPEKLRYRFDPATKAILREVNGSPAHALATGIDSFQFNYTFRGSAVGGSEKQLLVVAPGSTTAMIDITDSSWVAAYFTPSFDATISSWGVTRLRLGLASAGAADGRIRVRIVTAQAGAPRATVLGEAFVDESSLTPTLKAVELSFSGIAGLPPDQPIAIVLSPATGSTGFSGRVAYTSGSGLPTSTHLTTSNNSGASWSAPTSTEDLLFELIGVPVVRSN